ncbi:MAG: abortive infection family protein [Candidatus Cloacimonetes bacterium]|nr:abortive infection family protein [Candidatus Cloacimonadota bacterium]
MSNLKYVDQVKFEKLFGMSSGYVLNFSNSTFQAFVADSVGVDIYCGEYDYASCSKANMVRGFVKTATNYKVGIFLRDLLEHWKTIVNTPEESDWKLYLECQKIAEEMIKETGAVNISALDQFEDDLDFSRISVDIKDKLERNQPEMALDRLHTYLIKYFKKLCDDHKIEYSDNKLEGIAGKYINWLREKELFESKITIKILGSSIQILKYFNDVRNNQSFAHDNPILNYSESLLIFNNICNIVAFINNLEESLKKGEKHIIQDDDVL